MSYKFEALEVPVVNGIYKKDDGTKKLKTLRKLLDGEDISFEFQNIQLKQDTNEIQTSIVAPTKFYKSFKELEMEPKVPTAANENDIISFYQDCFTKYDGLGFDKKTLLYLNKTFPTFETEAILLSSLFQKSKDYKDFDKPYISVEFSVDTRSDEFRNIINKQFSKSISTEERNRYLKRFVKNSQQLSRRNVAVVKSHKGKEQSIYISYDDPKPADLTTQKDGQIFEKKFFPFDAGKNDRLTRSNAAFGPQFRGSPQIYSFDNILKGTTCSYDIIGYVLTKRKGNFVIKRTYILNDKQNFKGVLKYFDSQIKEDEEYSYTIEQINKIYGKTFDKQKDKKYKYPNGYEVKQKDFFRSAKVSIKKVFESLLVTDEVIANNEDEKIIPAYKTKDFRVEIPFTVNERPLVAYSPLSSVTDLESPDIKLNTKILLIKPSKPEMSIFSKKGESKNVLIMMTNILGVRQDVAGLADQQESKLKIIDLGFEINEIKILTKEFRLYRTSEKPKSYDSFPKEPHKILPIENPDFLDDIEPNVTYYYYAEGISLQGSKSDPSRVLKMQMVQEQDHIFMLLELYDFGEDKEIIKEKLFRKDLKISPTLLQSSVKDMVVGGYIKSEEKSGFSNKLFGDSSTILRGTATGSGPAQSPTHKIRITSKKTRRRLDVNTIFSFEEVKQFEQLPESAELVLEITPQEKADKAAQALGFASAADQQAALEEVTTGEKWRVAPADFAAFAAQVAAKQIASGDFLPSETKQMIKDIVNTTGLVTPIIPQGTKDKEKFAKEASEVLAQQIVDGDALSEETKSSIAAIAKAKNLVGDGSPAALFAAGVVTLDDTKKGKEPSKFANVGEAINKTVANVIAEQIKEGTVGEGTEFGETVKQAVEMAQTDALGTGTVLAGVAAALTEESEEEKEEKKKEILQYSSNQSAGGTTAAQTAPQTTQAKTVANDAKTKISKATASSGQNNVLAGLAAPATKAPVEPPKPKPKPKRKTEKEKAAEEAAAKQKAAKAVQDLLKKKKSGWWSF
jgi:hypothetical protein